VPPADSLGLRPLRRVAHGPPSPRSACSSLRATRPANA
jgi:hypothetical protein